MFRKFTKINKAHEIILKIDAYETHLFVQLKTTVYLDFCK